MPLKIIPPTSRERKRYLLVKVEADGSVSRTDLENTIVNSGLQFLGELGVGKSGMQVLGETFNGKSVIVRTGNKYVDETKTAISLIKSIGEKKARLSVVRVSGAIKNLKGEK
jgi:ribonuclease P/MRP protein subunit POP5